MSHRPHSFVSCLRHSFSFASGRRWLLVVATALFVATVAGVTTAAQDPERTVWDGVFAEDQAARGATVFSTNCARCHGSELEGNNATALVGEPFWQDFQSRTVEYLLTYITENMPNGNGGSLSDTTYLDLAAFILSRNEFPAGDAALTAEAAVGVQIIPEGGAGELPASTLVRVVGCLVEDGSGWSVTNAVAPARAEAADVASPEAATITLGDRSFALLFSLIPLDRFVGHRVWVRGLLIGEGGVDGINVSRVESLSDVCG